MIILSIKWRKKTRFLTVVNEHLATLPPLLHPLLPAQNAALFSAFPIVVPSLSWHVDRFSA
jgi:hypothetical protein